MRILLLTCAILLAVAGPNVHAQDSDEVRRLKERNELLETKLKLAEKEIETLKLKLELAAKAAPKAEKVAEDDTFAEGAILTGTRRFTGDEVAVPLQDMKLVVTKRTGTKFEGELSMTQRGSTFTRNIKVTGTASVGKSGKVEFETEKQGKFQVKFWGPLNNGETGLDFKGPNFEGKQVAGKGTLKKE